MLPRFATWLLVLLASVALPIALASAWFSSTVENTNQYVRTVEQLAESDDVVDIVGDRITARTLLAIGTPASEQPDVRALVRAGVDRALAGETFKTVWSQGNRQAHRQLVHLMESERLEANDRVVVDLSEVTRNLTSALSSAGIDVDLSQVDMNVEIANGNELNKAQDGWKLLQQAGLWLPIAWFLLVAITIATARQRLNTLGLLGVGALLAMLVTWLASITIAELVSRRSPDGDLTRAVLDVVLSTFDRWMLTTVVFAGIALVARAALGLIFAPRETPSSYFN